MRNSLLFLMVLINTGALQAQGVLDILRGHHGNRADFYEVEGISVTCQSTNLPFSKENIFKQYNEFIASESALSVKDENLKERNFFFEKIDTVASGLVQYNRCYYIETSDNSYIGILYSAVGKYDKPLENELNRLILDKNIDEHVFNKEFFNSFDFIGRHVKLDTYMCKWMGVNNIQWPYHGEMNWDIYRDSLDAAKQSEIQRQISNAKREKIGFYTLSDEMVDVLFESIPTKARKVIGYITEDFAELRASGDGNTNSLIIYYVVAPVRGYWVSCVMSHWNNDIIESDGLPSLHSKVMTLKD